MIRPILIGIGLFLTPFVLYAVFILLARADASLASAWTLRRVMALTITSLVLVIGGFLMLTQFDGAPPRATYVPAHMQDGQLIPGTTQ